MSELEALERVGALIAREYSWYHANPGIPLPNPCEPAYRRGVLDGLTLALEKLKVVRDALSGDSGASPTADTPSPVEGPPASS